MQVSFTWKIVPPLICIPRKDGQDNIVRRVTWAVTAYTDHVPPLITMHSDFMEFADEVGPTFTAFENLTEDQVIGWIKAELTEPMITTIENSLKERLYIESLPKTVEMPLPWEK